MDEQRTALIIFIAGVILTLISAILIFSGTFSIYVQIGVGIAGVALVATSRTKIMG